MYKNNYKCMTGQVFLQKEKKLFMGNSCHISEKYRNGRQSQDHFPKDKLDRGLLYGINSVDESTKRTANCTFVI